jgi:PAS domain S-box-containing protein
MRGAGLDFRRVIAASAALALLLAALTTGFAYTQLESNAKARFWVDHTHQVIEANQTLLTLEQRLENNQRAFLLTGEGEYLPQFEATRAQIPRAEATLVRLVTDSPDETAKVNALNETISRRADVLESSIGVARAGDFKTARINIFGVAGRAILPGIRVQSEAISATERTLLASRIHRASVTEQRALLIGLAVAALALLGLFGLVFDLARTNGRLRRALDDAAEARSDREASDALTRAVFDNSPDYLVVLEVRDQDRFVIADINPAFEKVLAIPTGSFRGKDLRELADPATAQRLIDHCRRVCGSDRPVLSRDVLADAPGGPRTWETVMAPVRNAEGVTDRIVGSVRDITGRVRTEERLREAQRMEAVGQLTGGVAHDFNNLLQVIRGNLELLEAVVGEREPGRRRLVMAIHGADRAAQLTRQLLAFARRQPLEPQVVNLSRLVGDMTELLRRTLGDAIEVETVIGGGLWNTLADPAQVESAILNLAINARDAMPEVGRLTVEVTNASLDERYVRDIDGISAGQFVLIAISDSGEGMSAETVQRVFEPFFTTKPDGKGSGLGLSMVYGFVRQSNGHIRIYSEPGQGTTVKIYLPRSREAVPAAISPRGAPDIGSNQTILVVEDEPAVRAAAVGMLESLGYRCLEAAEASAALEVLESGVPVDLVFTDVVMPGPLKTREFAERIEVIAPNLPILFTSGYTENAIVHHGRLDEGVTLLSKPYARHDLAERIARLLARNQPGA